MSPDRRGVLHTGARTNDGSAVLRLLGLISVRDPTVMQWIVGAQ